MSPLLLQLSLIQICHFVSDTIEDCVDFIRIITGFTPEKILHSHTLHTLYQKPICIAGGNILFCVTKNSITYTAPEERFYGLAVNNEAYDRSWSDLQAIQYLDYLRDLACVPTILLDGIGAEKEHRHPLKRE